jgi:hypothetical protein
VATNDPRRAHVHDQLASDDVLVLGCGAQGWPQASHHLLPGPFRVDTGDAIRRLHHQGRPARRRVELLGTEAARRWTPDANRL